MTGKMIVFDGNNGSGKSTQLEYARDYLVSEGHNVVVTREPGGTPIAEDIRSLLLSTRSDGEAPTPTTEVFLFFAARAQHVEARILPALDDGAVVLCDRFTSATVAFQCFAQDFPIARMREIERAALGSFKPDLTLVFDIDTQEGLERTAVRRGDDRIETIPIHKLERARHGFLWQASEQPERFSVIDASLTREAVFEQVKSSIDQLMSQHLQNQSL